MALRVQVFHPGAANTAAGACQAYARSKEHLLRVLKVGRVWIYICAQGLVLASMEITF